MEEQLRELLKRWENITEDQITYSNKLLDEYDRGNHKAWEEFEVVFGKRIQLKGCIYDLKCLMGLL